MKKWATLIAAIAALLAVALTPEVASARHGWHGGNWHGGHHWHGGWGPRWGWGWGPRWGWGWGPGVGIAIGPGFYGRRCWSNYYGRFVPCRWLY
jgi:hypothetical protein